MCLLCVSFNPRTYIRYDGWQPMICVLGKVFQSTYLYKVRHDILLACNVLILFQSTYLYKVRPHICFHPLAICQFQSTYLYKVRQCRKTVIVLNGSFNPRTYIRYDGVLCSLLTSQTGFNPRTYIRYD